MKLTIEEIFDLKEEGFKPIQVEKIEKILSKERKQTKEKQELKSVKFRKKRKGVGGKGRAAIVREMILTTPNGCSLKEITKRLEEFGMGTTSQNLSSTLLQLHKRSSVIVRVKEVRDGKMVYVYYPKN